MMKIFNIFVLTIFIFNYSNILIANPKSNIIEEINSSDNLKFNFVQKSFNKEEKGICYLKRPYYLKCLYSDKKQKELIINKKKLVIFHKRYNKGYFYPASKSYLIEILDKKKFSELINAGELKINKKNIEIVFLNANKGKVIFYFNIEKFDLSGWKITDLNGNETIFEVTNLKKNQDINKKLFTIPSFN